MERVKVVSVLDGDTVEILGPGPQLRRLRLAGVDAPELAQPRGEQARERLLQMALGQEALIVPLGQDRYGRLLGTLSVRGLDIGVDLIGQGLAWRYRTCPGKSFAQLCGEYRWVEGRARARGVGVWADEDRMAPWDWRRQRRVWAPRPEV